MPVVRQKSERDACMEPNQRSNDTFLANIKKLIN